MKKIFALVVLLVGFSVFASAFKCSDPQYQNECACKYCSGVTNIHSSDCGGNWPQTWSACNCTVPITLNGVTLSLNGVGCTAGGAITAHSASVIITGGSHVNIGLHDSSSLSADKATIDSITDYSNSHSVVLSTPATATVTNDGSASTHDTKWRAQFIALNGSCGADELAQCEEGLTNLSSCKCIIDNVSVYVFNNALSQPVFTGSTLNTSSSGPEFESSAYTAQLQSKHQTTSQTTSFSFTAWAVLESGDTNLTGSTKFSLSGDQVLEGGAGFSGFGETGNNLRKLFFQAPSLPTGPIIITLSEPSTCTDTDGGKVPEVQGTCTDSTGDYTDYCSKPSLEEYYCDSKPKQVPGPDSSTCALEEMPCSKGGECSDGACVAPSATPSPSSLPTPSPSASPSVQPSASPQASALPPYPSEVSFLSLECPQRIIFENSTTITARLVVSGTPTCDPQMTLQVTMNTSTKTYDNPSCTTAGVNEFVVATDATGKYDCSAQSSLGAQLKDSCSFRAVHAPRVAYTESNVLIMLATALIAFLAYYWLKTRREPAAAKASKPGKATKASKR